MGKKIGYSSLRKELDTMSLTIQLNRSVKIVILRNRGSHLAKVCEELAVTRSLSHLKGVWPFLGGKGTEVKAFW